MKDRTVVIICVTVMLVILILGARPPKPTESVEEIKFIRDISECENLTFFTKVECIRDYIKPHYKYKMRSDKLRTMADVMVNGGDCFDWSHLYKNLAIELGLNAYVTYIYGDEYGHAFAVIWDDKMTGYCITSSLQLDCTALGEVNLEEWRLAE